MSIKIFNNDIETGPEIQVRAVSESLVVIKMDARVCLNPYFDLNSPMGLLLVSSVNVLQLCAPRHCRQPGNHDAN